MTAIIPTVLRRRDFIANKQRMWGVFHLIPLVYMICTAMFGNGAAINRTIIIVAHRLTEVLGKLVDQNTECCVAVPGAAMRSIAVVPIVAGIRRTIVARTSVFA